MKKVSIIIPLYNAEGHLRDCLNTIVNQDYKNLEIILVNDGSTDGTLKICHEFADNDNRITVLSFPNGGAGAAKNHGIDVATGDYLTFVDGDDWLENNYISALVNQKEKYKSNISGTSYKIFRQDDSTYYVVMDPKPGDTYYDGVEKSPAWLEKFLPCIWPFDGYTTAKLFDRSLFKNIRYPENWTICEDEFILWKLVLLSNSVSFENVLTYYYRTHQTTSLTTNNNQLYYSQVELLKEKIAVCKAAGIDTNYLHDHFIHRLQQLNNAAQDGGDYETAQAVQYELNILKKFGDHRGSNNA